MQTNTNALLLITYEQPLNEQTRICLRLEHLFNSLRESCEKPSVTASHTAVITLLKTLEVIDRPDLKSKLTQALTQHAMTLGQLAPFPQVDPQRLNSVLYKLDTHIKSLHNNHNRIGESLRTNEFLNQIRMHLGGPGGPSYFTNPAFALWLKQPARKRMEDLNRWCYELTEIDAITRLILKLTRESTSPQRIACSDGFFHQSLDAALPCQLVQVSLPVHLNIYPEISAGKHRLVIRFLQPDYHDKARPSQFNHPFEFDLCCCRL